MRNPRFLFACLLSSFAALLGSSAQAQIVPDQTLGAESSIVVPDIEVRGDLADLIEGGATRGANLFHSFSDFNVLDSQRVYFANPEGIESILSRVTGNDLSNIFGTLGVDGTADLFFINPNGVVFKGNASLDLQGSFTATTASGVQLGEGGLFSVEVPFQDSLLSVKPSAFFFNGLDASAGINIETQNIGSLSLEVPSGETLSLIGGDISIDSGRLSALGGRVQLGSILGVGTVDVNASGEIIGFEAAQQGQVVLENRSIVDVQSSNGGDIYLFGEDLGIFSGSQLRAGIRLNVRVF